MIRSARADESLRPINHLTNFDNIGLMYLFI